tara:strand:+ start:2751 stop:3446 length:696 start_codon:yes stop_codon:yes gene_type:complete
MNIRKIFLSISTIILFSITAVQVQANSWGVGIKIDKHTLDTGASDDIDSNGTIDSTKSFEDKATGLSVFVERNIETGFGNVAFGINIIPGEVDIDKRSVSQSSLKAKANGAATTGTNSAEGTVSNHYSLYVQPGINLGASSNMLYLSFGMSFADVEGKNNSISSTNITESKSLDGTQLGIGLKRTGDNGGFLKLEYSQTDYDKVSWKTSNSTTAHADLDNEILSLAVGRQF